jgi:hypothetical protein
MGKADPATTSKNSLRFSAFDVFFGVRMTPSMSRNVFFISGKFAHIHDCHIRLPKFVIKCKDAAYSSGQVAFENVFILMKISVAKLIKNLSD